MFNLQMVNFDETLRKIPDGTGLTEKYQARVRNEAIQLELKVEKLEGFLKTESFNNLPLSDKELLQHQLSAMIYYLHILIKRLERFISLNLIDREDFNNDRG